MNGLKATLSDKASGMAAARYDFDRAAIYAGWEYILFVNPSDAYPNGFTTIGNYPVPAGFVNATAYTEHKILRVFWTGVKYAIRDDLDIAAAYYHYYQNDYNTSPCTDGSLSASSCRGALNAYSAMIDYRPSKRIETYAGFMWSQVTGGMASGYLIPRPCPDDRRAGGVLVGLPPYGESSVSKGAELKSDPHGSSP